MKEKIIITVAMTLLTLAAAELLLRLLPPDLSSMRQLLDIDESLPMAYRLKASTTVSFNGMYERLPEPVEWQTNDSGIRSTRNYEPKSSKFRILTFGDSDIFGWSVNHHETFQQQMEAIDQQVEVINFGIPGYNVTNIADYLHMVIQDYQPNMVMYVVNKNDYDDAIQFGSLIADSAIFLRLRLLYHVTLAKPERIRLRHSVERRELFADEVLRMYQTSKEQGAAFVLGFIKWQNWNDLIELQNGQHPVVKLANAGSITVINTQPSFVGQPRFDDHISAPGYESMAALICRELAGASGGCVPGGDFEVATSAQGEL
jgi:lysophospholipase L1-like esterase